VAPTFGQIKSFVETLKTLVYSSPIEQEETLHKLIFEGCQNKCHHPRTCEKVWQSMIKCVLLHWFRWRTFGELVVNWAW